MPKLPEWKIERYMLGELPVEEMQKIDRLRAEDAEFDAEIGATIDRLQASNQEILAKYPAEQMAAMIRQRTEQRAVSESGAEPEAETEARPKDRRHRPFFALPQVVFPAALAAALALFILFSGQFAFLGLPGAAGGNGGGTGAAGSSTTAGTGTEDGSGGQQIQGLEGEIGIRLKGMEAGIQVFRKNGETVEMLEPGAEAAEGDLLQIGFVAPEAQYAVLFSVDGRGLVTLHLPDSAKQTSEIAAQSRVLTDASYRLDNAPEYERFYLVTSTAELDTIEVLTTVRTYIRRKGHFPGSPSELNSNEELADLSAGQLKWYVFTLRK